MEVAKLTGARLDYWVARADVPSPDRLEIRDGAVWYQTPSGLWGSLHYSTDWRHGGPIIEREEICIEPLAHVVEENGVTDWRAVIYYDGGEQYFTDAAPTALVAAMRAYVASKFGDEVPDEESSDAP